MLNSECHIVAQLVIHRRHPRFRVLEAILSQAQDNYDRTNFQSILLAGMMKFTPRCLSSIWLHSQCRYSTQIYLIDRRHSTSAPRTLRSPSIIEGYMNGRWLVINLTQWIKNAEGKESHRWALKTKKRVASAFYHKSRHSPSDNRKSMNPNEKNQSHRLGNRERRPLQASILTSLLRGKKCVRN